MWSNKRFRISPDGEKCIYLKKENLYYYNGKKSEKIALGLSSGISFISKLFAPLVWLLTVPTNLLLRLIGIDPNAADEEISEEDTVVPISRRIRMSDITAVRTRVRIFIWDPAF